MPRSIPVALLASLLAALPRAAEACSVCVTSDSEGTRAAFIATTVFLSLLPIGIIGGVVFFLRRRVKALERQATELGSVAAPSA